jgi:hypothetical protein
VSITEVVLFSTTNPTKLSLNFSEFSTTFYAFYKFLQIGYTIEDVTLRLGPWKNLGPCNWVPRPTGRRARRKSGGSSGAPGRETGRGGPHAQLGSIGGHGWGRDVAGAGARRWPAAVAAAARAPARGGRSGGNLWLVEVLRSLRRLLTHAVA